MSVARYILGDANAWTEIDPAVVGNEVTVLIDGGSTDVFEMAVSDASPAGAGTVVAADVANKVIIPVGSANSAWVRNTANAGGVVTVDDQLEGQVFIGA